MDDMIWIGKRLTVALAAAMFVDGISEDRIAA